MVSRVYDGRSWMKCIDTNKDKEGKKQKKKRLNLMNKWKPDDTKASDGVTSLWWEKLDEENSTSIQEEWRKER